MKKFISTLSTLVAIIVFFCIFYKLKSSHEECEKREGMQHEIEMFYAPGLAELGKPCGKQDPLRITLAWPGYAACNVFGQQ